MRPCKNNWQSRWRGAFLAALFVFAPLAASFCFNSLALPNCFEPSRAQAIILPINGGSHVTARIVDSTPPSTPILVTPANGTALTTNLPTFVWQESTDDYGMGSYQLFIDGATFLINIPLAAASTSTYDLTYDNLVGEYQLAIKIPLSEGSHNWKIRALDQSNNYSDSATWLFSVDTIAPSFVLSSIGNTAVSISAQDLSTVPTTAVSVTVNEPLLTAAGEAGSTVTTVLSIPGASSQTFTNTINSQGSWQLQLGILPRDTIITASFTIVDAVGHVSILDGVKFIIPTTVVILPTGVPVIVVVTSSVSATVTPTSGTSGGTSSAGGSSSSGNKKNQLPGVNPFPGLPPVIPILPPKEIAYDAIKKVGEFLPPIISATTTPVALSILNWLSRNIWFSSWLNLIVVSTIPLLATLILATRFGTNFSLQSLKAIWQALGYLPNKILSNIVVDFENGCPCPFVIIRPEMQSPLISNKDGLFVSLRPSVGQFRLIVDDDAYLFPTKTMASNCNSVLDFYRGENLIINNDPTKNDYLSNKSNLSETNELVLSGLVMPVEMKYERSFFSKINQKILYLATWPTRIIVGEFFLTFIIAAIFPSLINWLVVGWLLTLILKLILWNIFFSSQQKNMYYSIVDTNKSPLSGVLIKVSNSANSDILSDSHAETVFALSDKNGLAKILLTKKTENIYEQVIKPGMFWPINGIENSNSCVLAKSPLVTDKSITMSPDGNNPNPTCTI